jgi:hypothetical protein
MAGFRTLEVEGHGGRTLPCVLYDAGSTASAVVLPGASRAGYRLGGTPARPDLHYTRALLLAHGISVLEAWWDVETLPEGEEREAWLERNAEAAARAADKAAPVRILVGRSTGTRAVAKLVGRSEWQDAATIWIAPLNRHAEVHAALEGGRGPAFVVGGTADDLFDAEAALALRERGATVFLVEQGNHALEVGDAPQSARALADVLEAMASFLATL